MSWGWNSLIDLKFQPTVAALERYNDRSCTIRKLQREHVRRRIELFEAWLDQLGFIAELVCKVTLCCEKLEFDLA